MAFDGNEGSFIDNAKAGAWTKSYREKTPNGLMGHFFGRKVLQDLLDREGCMGIRFYYGLHDEVQQLLAVGADHEQNDQLPTTQDVVDESKPCPPDCSQPNVLNS